MFAGAAFTDQADISQTEAVDMLNALGVIQGYEDGSFRPDATITRAEAAKMIYTIWNGGNDDASAFVGTSNFSDVYSGHWAEGYINFCYANGIIAGIGNNKFAPEENVTGTELAKMLLICMGYQADKSNLTGTSWVQNTNALATQNALYTDVTAAVGSAMPRQFAAQIMYNALKADTVTWSTDSNAYEKVRTTAMTGYQDSTGNWHFTNTYVNETLGSKCMDLTIWEDVRLNTVEKEDNRDTYSLNGGLFTRVTKDYSDLIGQNVNVLYKDGETDKVYGVYANEDSKVVATSALVNVESASSGQKVKVDGTEYKVEGDALSNVSTYNFNDDTAIVINGTSCANLNAVITTANAASYDAWDAYTVKLMDNDGNGKIDHAVITPVTVGQVTYVGSSSINVTANGTTTPYKFADDNIYEGAARDDWAYVTPKAYTADDKNVISKADVVSGTVTATKTSSGKVQVQVDGTWYKVVSSITDIEAGSSYDLVVYNGLVFDAQLTSDGTASNILYISAVDKYEKSFSSDEATVDAKAYFADGSDAVITVSRVNGEKLTGKSNKAAVEPVVANKMYTYSKNSSGEYEIKELANAAGATTLTGVIAGDPGISKNTAGYKAYVTAASMDITNGKIGAYPLADDSIVFLQSTKVGSEEVKVVSGKTAKNLTGASFGTSAAVLTKVVNGINYAQVAFVCDSAAALPAGTVYGRSFAYLLTDPMTTMLDGNRCTALNVWTENGAETLYVDSTSVTITGRLFSYETDGKYIKNILDMGDGKVAAVAITGVEPTSEGAVELYYADRTPTGTYKFDKDVVILSVDDSDRSGVEGASYAAIPYAKTDNAGKITKNAYIYYEGSTIYAIVYDVNNELDGAPEFIL